VSNYSQLTGADYLKLITVAVLVAVLVSAFNKDSLGSLAAPGDFVCRFCGDRFSTEEQLEEHIKIYHEQEYYG